MITKTIDELDEQQLSLVIKIFFETTTVTNFSSEEAKELLLYRYFGYYQETNPELFLIAFDDEATDIPLGYICGMTESFSDQALIKLQPQIEYYAEFGDEFPAHLHINISPSAQGKGIGGKLLDAFCEKLKSDKCPGVHIITAPESRNRQFYARHGFSLEIIKKINEVDLLFMGKTINS